MSDDREQPASAGCTKHSGCGRILRELREIVRHLGDHTCQQAVELVTHYIEDAMEPGDKRRFERHLHNCPDCTRYVEQIRFTFDTLGRAHPEPPTGPTRDALVQAFREFHREWPPAPTPRTSPGSGGDDRRRAGGRTGCL